MKKMKSKKLLWVLITAALVIIAVSVAVSVNATTLSANTEVSGDSVYMPKRMADKYNNLLAFSFDDHRMWVYELQADETAAIEENIGNGIWQKPTEEQYEDIIGVYFEFGAQRNMPDGLSENNEDIFYCLYDNALDKFITIDDGSPLGWHRELFIYDASSKLYVSVSMGV